MKLLVFALVILQLANYIATQCVSPWTYVNGQCMVCDSTIPGAPAVANYLPAQATCVDNGGNLATVINGEQAAFAFACGNDPWFGYMDAPLPKFLDGTPFKSFGALGTAPTFPSIDGCFHMTAAITWEELIQTSCTDDHGYACSRPTMTCPDLEVNGPLSASYNLPGSTPHPAGWKWVETVVTYGCAPGFTRVGPETRTCQADRTWTETEPYCVHTGICPALFQAQHATLAYSGVAASNTQYTVGTVATQMCMADYEKEDGTYTRTCLADGTWTGGMIECEKENNNALALGLGLGLGLLALVGIVILLWCCLCRPGGMGTPPPPARPGYPRPRPGYPRPVRGYPRRAY